MAIRIVLTVLLLGAFGLVAGVFGAVSPLVTTEMAGQQLQNSNTGWLGAAVGLAAWGQIGRGGQVLAVAVVVLLLALIWAPALRGRLRRLPPALLAMVLPVMLATPARAYFDTTDKTEAYFILPNESAFWIPDVGANKDSQGRLEGADYLAANKIAAKRFIVPHAKLGNSGGSWGWDAYVPTGRLIIVDRTPYNREWTRSARRGTSTGDQSFPCQSREGLNVTVEASIAVSVLEENSPRYLYYFGVRPPPGDRTSQAVIFTSVFYGRPLTEIMDTVGRGEIQTLVCSEVSARKLDDVNDQAGAILTAVQTKATTFLAQRGITLDYFGWAGTFTFDDDVQLAINRRYDAEKIAPVLETLTTKAAIDALAKWDGRLPTQVSGLAIVPGDLLGSITAWFTKAQK